MNAILELVDPPGRVTQVDIARGVKLALVLGLAGLLYAEIVPELLSDWWNDPNASQGMLIPPLAAYIAWMLRGKTLSFPAAPDSRGLALIAGACLMFLIGKLGAEFFLTRISMVVLLAGLLWTFWGLPRTRTLVFPLLLLGTMVPLPSLVYNALAAPLQLFASDVSSHLAQALGVSVYQDGNVIHLAQISLGVAEACSGLHSLSALFVAALLLGYLHTSSLVARVLVVMLSVPLAIAINVLRVTGTAVLADYDRQLALGFYHSFSGWLVFVAGLGMLWVIVKLAHRLLDR